MIDIETTARGQTPRATIKGADIRRALQARLTRAQREAMEYLKLLRMAPSSPQLMVARQRLRESLSRKSAYTALLRSAFADYPKIVELFDSPT